MQNGSVIIALLVLLLLPAITPQNFLINNTFVSYGQSKNTEDICELIRTKLQTTSSVFVDKIDGSFFEENFRKMIKGSLLLISGSWKDWGKNTNPIELIRKLLSDRGWSESLEHSADGPDGTSFSYKKNDNWCLVSGRWDGGDDSDSTYVPFDSYRIIVMSGKFVAKGNEQEGKKNR
jgi:hypothetical protein